MSQASLGMRIQHCMQWCHRCHTQQVLFLIYNNEGICRVFDAQCLKCGYDHGRSLINTLCGFEVIPNQPRQPLNWAKLHICPECVSTNCLGWYRGEEAVAFECYECDYLILPSYLGQICGLKKKA